MGSSGLACAASCNAHVCLPLLYLVGAQKSGSTSVFQLLRQHGYCNASVPSGRPAFFAKETHFLTSAAARADDSYDARLTHAQNRWRYAARFPAHACPTRCYVDATPNYLSDWVAPARLYGILSARERALARLLVIVRHPVARDLSWFNHQASTLRGPAVNASYDAYAEYADRNLAAFDACAPHLGASLARYEACASLTFSAGLYWAQLTRWAHLVPAEQTRVWQFERLVRAASAPELVRWARANDDGAAVLPHANERAFDGKLAAMPCGTRARVARAYAPWNDKLFLAHPHLDASLWRAHAPSCT